MCISKCVCLKLMINDVAGIQISIEYIKKKSCVHSFSGRSVMWNILHLAIAHVSRYEPLALLSLRMYGAAVVQQLNSL